MLLPSDRATKMAVLMMETHAADGGQAEEQEEEHEEEEIKLQILHRLPGEAVVLEMLISPTPTVNATSETVVTRCTKALRCPHIYTGRDPVSCVIAVLILLLCRLKFPFIILLLQLLLMFIIFFLSLFLLS